MFTHTNMFFVLFLPPSLWGPPPFLPTTKHINSHSSILKKMCLLQFVCCNNYQGLTSGSFQMTTQSPTIIICSSLDLVMLPSPFCNIVILFFFLGRQIQRHALMWSWKTPSGKLRRSRVRSSTISGMFKIKGGKKSLTKCSNSDNKKIIFNVSLFFYSTVL